MPVSTPSAPPIIPTARPLEPLVSEKEEKRLKVLQHFSDNNYTIPGIEKNGQLDELEKFWLVSYELHSTSALVLTLILIE